MYLDDPFETDFEYPGYFHIAVAVAPHASRTLVIGLGGGTVVKRMWRDYPQMQIDAVELDPEVVEVARYYFAVPEDERIRLIVGDGRGFLGMSNECYDIVIIDAYDDDHVPRPLTTEEFMREAHARMREGGAIAFNLIGAVYGPKSRQFRSVYRTARNVWSHVWVFPVGSSDDMSDSTRNIIMIASDAGIGDDELLDRIASRVDGLITVPKFEQFADDLYRGNIRSGDVPLCVDPPRRKHADRR
jgi:SAM-dependent methyltransferase